MKHAVYTLFGCTIELTDDGTFASCTLPTGDTRNFHKRAGEPTPQEQAQRLAKQFKIHGKAAEDNE